MDASGLRSKAGPLPIWAWGALLGLVAVGFIYWRSSNAAANSAAAGTTDSGSQIDPTVDYTAAGLGATQASSDTTNADTSSSTPVYGDNDSWVSGIVQWLNGQGKDPIKVRQALTNYLNGGIITPDQLAIIKSAIGYAGDAPDGLAGTPTEAVTPPVKAPGSVIPGPVRGTNLPHKAAPTKRAPVTSVKYRIVSGDSLSKIAKHFYGSASEANIRKLQTANHISNPNVIIAGHTITIPK